MSVEKTAKRVIENPLESSQSFYTLQNRPEITSQKFKEEDQTEFKFKQPLSSHSTPALPVESNQNKNINISTYKKRSGTSDHGRNYEWLLCAYYSLKLSLSSDVTDFQLFTNNEFFGDFDDVVLRVKFSDGSVKVFLLQLKHSEKKKNLALTSLTSPSGDFTLLKYKKSYNSCISLGNFYYVLYTNKSAKFKNGTKIIVEGENVVINQHTCVGDGLLDTNSTGNYSVFKFEVVANQGSEFFANFYLYANQQNDTNLKHSISDLLKNALHCDIHMPFVEFMRRWWEGNFKLTKEDVVVKLAELVLSPMIKTLTCDESNDRTELIKDAIMFSDITVVSENTKVSKIWTRMSQETDIKRASFTALKFGLTMRSISKIEELPPEKRSKVLWFMGIVPLIIESQYSKHTQIGAIISLLGRCQQKKIVIVGEVPRANLSKWKRLESLADVRPEELRKKIATTFICTLQGKRSVTLARLGIDDTFKVAQLLEIATSDSFNIGENLEMLPPVYIPRSFYKILLDYNVVDDFKTSNIFLSCNNQNIPRGKIKKRQVPFSDVKKTKMKNDDDAFNNIATEAFFKHNIYVSRDEFKRDIIEESAAHHFRVIDSQNLQWLSSNKDIEAIRKYQRISMSHIVSESEIDDHFHTKIRLLISHTGTGKTSFLNRVKNEAPPDHLVIKMNLKEHSHFFQPDRNSDVWSYIVRYSETSRNYNFFETELMRTFSEDKIVILWDGFDDLHEDSKGDFIESVRYLRRSGISQWITAQNRSKRILEEALGILSMTLVPFSQEEQIRYIQKRCGDVDNIVLKNFYENVKVIDNQEYLGVPLQLYILTDVFCREPKLLETVYTLTDIFTAYIDGKYKHFLKTEGTSTEIRSFGSFIQDAKSYRLSQYKIAALRSHLPELSAKLCLQNDQKFVDDIKGGDFLDLIVKVDDKGICVFEHQILGEYLSALYLAENLHSGLKEYLFHDKCRNIRFMFDLLLADRDPTLIAILYKKFDSVRTDTVRDKAGRSPLHLICSYGRKHPVKIGSTIQEEDERLEATVKTLCKRYNPFAKDKLFKWSSYNYAEHSHSLGLIEVLGTKLESVIRDLRCYNVGTILYYSIKMNYSKLLASVKVVPYFEDSNGHNLLHLTTELERHEYLTYLLSQNTYIELINKPNEDGWTPLHLATFNGDLQLVKLLITKGATIKLREPSPMSLAVAKGRKDIVEYFLECGCSPNEFYHTNPFTTSIFQAIHLKLDDIVELLLEHGAKLVCSNRLELENREYKKPDPAIPTQVGTNNAFGMNLFHLLLENDQFVEAEAVLKRGIHVDSTDYEGKTAFHHAASSNRETVVRFLLAKGGNCQVLDNIGQSPLHSAAKAGSAEVANILITDGCDVNLEDKNDMTPIHLAVLWGKIGFVTFLIEKGANPNINNRYGRVPMHTAAQLNLSECISLLYENGADFDKRDGLYGRTPLHLAAWHGNDDAVRILLKLGAEVDSRCRFGYTPLHLAVENSRLDACKLLLKAGASVSVVNINKRTPFSLVNKEDLTMCRFVCEYDKLPIHAAVTRSHLGFISELVSIGYDVNERDEDANTPLHVAARSPIEIIGELIKLGGDVKAQNRFGYSPLHCALHTIATEKVRVERLASKDTVNCATVTGVTPLHLAAQSASAEAEDITKLLIEKGAKVDATDHDGYTPLHYAAFDGKLEVVTILAKGTEIDKLTKLSRTPLHMAATGGHVKVVEYLLSQNASIEVRDVNGNTCVDDALKNKHFEVLRVFGQEPKETFSDTIDNNGIIDIEEALYSRQYDIFTDLLKKSDFDVNKYSERHKKYPLQVVACTGNLDLVKLLVERGAKVDVVDEKGNTLLHYLLHDYVFDFLMKCGSAAINLRNREGETPLHTAVKLERNEVIDALIDGGANLDLVDNKGNTPFDLSLEKKQPRMKMLQKMTSFDIDKCGPDGKTLLHMAVISDLKMVEWLIQKGASINAKDTEGRTPLHLAAKSDIKILTLLIDNCTDLNVTTHSGNTALHYAASFSLPHVEELIKRGACPSIPNKFGEIPLHHALKDPKIFKFLCDNTPNVDNFSIADHTTRTVLHKAAHEGDFESVKIFSKTHFKCNDPDEKGRTPIWEAATGGHLEILEFMLQQDQKSINICNRKGLTLLHLAARRRNFKLVELLVKYGARKDLYTDDGRTAADLEAEQNNTEIYNFFTGSCESREGDRKCILS